MFDLLKSLMEVLGQVLKLVWGFVKWIFKKFWWVIALVITTIFTVFTIRHANKEDE